MPTAVVDLDAAALPPSFAVASHYERAFILFRWRRHPVGHVTLPVRGGVLDGRALRMAALHKNIPAISARRLREVLGCDAGALRPPIPATVAVCTRDRLDDLARCLTALDALWDDGQEVLVIDSASREPTAIRELVSRTRRARYIRVERPGLDVARNVALREARHDIVAFTDDDAIPDPGWLRALVCNFHNPRTLCVTGLTLPAELETAAQELFEQTGGFARGYQRLVLDGLSADPFAVSQVGAGVNMALRRTVLSLIGSFDEALDAGTATRSGGDHDMFTRILTAGYRIVYDPAALTWHRHRRTWPELRATLHGYGTGVTAYLTGHFIRGDVRALRVALGWMRWQLGGIGRTMLGRSGSMPIDLALAQLAGCFSGPLAYVKARRHARRFGPGVMQEAMR